jgi:hypothetical protein
MARLPQDPDLMPQESSDQDAVAAAPAPSPAQPSIKDFLMTDPAAMLKASADASNQRAALQGLGGIGDALANRQSFGNFFLGQMNPKVDVSSSMNKMAGEIADPVQKRQQLLNAYKESMAAQNQSDDMDPTSKRSIGRAQQMKSMLQAAKLGSLASTVGSGMTSEQAANLEKLYPQIMAGQNEIQKTAMMGQNAKELEAMREKGELGKIAAEYGLKRTLPGQISPEESLKLGQNQNALSSIKDLRDMIQSNKSDFGPLAGRIASLNPKNEVGQAYPTSVDAAATQVGNAFSNGAMNARMKDFYKGMLPKSSDTPDVALTKLDKLQHDLEQKHANDMAVLRARNTDLRGFDNNPGVSPVPAGLVGMKPQGGLISSANADSAPAQVKMVNGRLYQKVDGGWKGL